MENYLFIEQEEGFIKQNGYKLLKEDEKVKLKVELTKSTLNPYGIAHGGLIFGLGDTIMGIVARNTKKQNCVTINSNIDFLKPGKGKYLIAEAKPVKVGDTICVLKTKIYNDNGELIATMSGTYYYI